MAEPTRRLERTETGEVETDSLSSVELGENAKGEVSVKSVKVYHANVAEAGRLALAEFRRLHIELSSGQGQKPAAMKEA